jgi:amidohydrolase
MMKTLDLAQALSDLLITWRRYLHRHPELGFQEWQTAAFAADLLRDWGYTVQTGVAKTGVVAVLENGAGPVIMARVDMDALPIQEANEVSYASETAGVMHACGHDAHVAMGLGVARLMMEHRDAWRGTLKLVFQPGEEGMNGAEVMVQEGVLENPHPEAVLAMHVWADMPVGKIGVMPGPVMAAAEDWGAAIIGRGGHASQPHETVDALVTAAMAVTALQTVVSRNVSPMETAVVTVGVLRAGDAFNIIPERAEMRGTIRTFDPKVREDVLRRVRSVMENTAQAMGARAELYFQALSPAVINDPAVTEVVQAATRDLLGPEAVLLGFRTMGSEDASYFLRERPGCYFFVGARPVDREFAPHHNPRFDIDERALALGVAVMVESLCRLLPVSEVS